MADPLGIVAAPEPRHSRIRAAAAVLPAALALAAACAGPAGEPSRAETDRGTTPAAPAAHPVDPAPAPPGGVAVAPRRPYEGTATVGVFVQFDSSKLWNDSVRRRCEAALRRELAAHPRIQILGTASIGRLGADLAAAPDRMTAPWLRRAAARLRAADEVPSAWIEATFGLRPDIKRDRVTNDPVEYPKLTIVLRAQDAEHADRDAEAEASGHLLQQEQVVASCVDRILEALFDGVLVGRTARISPEAATRARDDRLEVGPDADVTGGRVRSRTGR